MTSSSVRAPAAVNQGHVGEDARDRGGIRGLGRLGGGCFQQGDGHRGRSRRRLSHKSDTLTL